MGCTRAVVQLWLKPEMSNQCSADHFNFYKCSLTIMLFLITLFAKDQNHKQMLMHVAQLTIVFQICYVK